jgi:hypothetical protein
MPKSCTICAHPERQAMEDALFRNKTPFRNVSEQYGVTVSALFRHKKHVAQRLVRTVSDVTGSLSPKKRRYVEERLSGKSRRASALIAGYSESMANHPNKVETQNVREAFAVLIRETVPPERIAKAIMEGLDANETRFFAHEGKVQDSREIPSWSERRQYAELAAE